MLHGDFVRIINSSSALIEGYPFPIHNVEAVTDVDSNEVELRTAGGTVLRGCRDLANRIIKGKITNVKLVPITKTRGFLLGNIRNAASYAAIAVPAVVGGTHTSCMVYIGPQRIYIRDRQSLTERDIVSGFHISMDLVSTISASLDNLADFVYCLRRVIANGSDGIFFIDNGVVIRFDNNDLLIIREPTDADLEPYKIDDILASINTILDC